MSNPEEDEVEASRAPLLDHLIELRTRLIRAMIAVLIAYVPGRETLIAGISELLPGEIVAWRRGTLTRTWYWALHGAVDDQSPAGGPDSEPSPAPLADASNAGVPG